VRVPGAEDRVVGMMYSPDLWTVAER
jgi:hypothetical protein